MGRWEDLDKKRAVQSGKGPGEFGPDYSDRKKYQLGHGNESPSPVLKEFLVNTDRNPRQSPYPTHVIEEYNVDEHIKNANKRKTKMACNNIDCHCENCTCDPCICTIDNPCGCEENHSNDWKGLV